MAGTVLFPVINLADTGRRIERFRKEAGLSVRDVQNYFGFEYPQAVYKWQHGECLPSVDNLLALARLLRVKMEDLLVYEDQEVPLFYLLFDKQVQMYHCFQCAHKKTASVTSGSLHCRSDGYAVVRLGYFHSACCSAHAACGSWA